MHPVELTYMTAEGAEIIQPAYTALSENGGAE